MFESPKKDLSKKEREYLLLSDMYFCGIYGKQGTIIGLIELK